MAQTPNTCLISTPGHITTHQAPTNNSCGCNKKPILNPRDVFKPPCSRKSLWLICFDNVWLQSDNAKANVKVVLGTALKPWSLMSAYWTCFFGWLWTEDVYVQLVIFIWCWEHTELPPLCKYTGSSYHWYIFITQFLSHIFSPHNSEFIFQNSFFSSQFWLNYFSTELLNTNSKLWDINSHKIIDL